MNHPLAAMARRIGGDAVVVGFPAPRGVDPAFWRPTEADIALYQEADLILLNGARYAKWVARATLPRRALIDTSAGFADQYLETRAVTHSHGPEGDHSHGGVAYTTWLDLDQATQQAAEILRAIVARRPEATTAATAAFEALRTELAGLDARLRAVGAQAPAMVVSHPVYGYLARRYGFDVRSMRWAAGALPEPEAWAALEAKLARAPAGVFLWEASPAPEAVARLQQLGLKSIVFDPCANAPVEGDFLDVLAGNVERLEHAVAADGDGR